MDIDKDVGVQYTVATWWSTWDKNMRLRFWVWTGTLDQSLSICLSVCVSRGKVTDVLKLHAVKGYRAPLLRPSGVWSDSLTCCHYPLGRIWEGVIWVVCGATVNSQ
jgi:hypothetical protein